MLFGARNVLIVEARPKRGVLAVIRRRWWQSDGREQTSRIDEIDKIDVKAPLAKIKRKAHTGLWCV